MFFKYSVENLIYSVKDVAFNTRISDSFIVERFGGYPNILIHYVKEGCMQICFRNRNYTVNAGECFILPAYEAHMYKNVGTNRIIIDWMSLIGGDSNELIRATLERRSPVFNVEQSKSIHTYFQRIKRIRQRSDLPKNAFLTSRTIYAMLLKTLEFAYPDENMIKKAERTKASEVLDYINANLDKELTNEIIANGVYISQSHLVKSFNKMFGITPAKYILNRRLSLARERLISSDDNICEISSSLGFCSPSHFVHTFKNHEGMTPVEFRKQWLLYDYTK